MVLKGTFLYLAVRQATVAVSLIVGKQLTAL